MELAVDYIREGARRFGDNVAVYFGDEQLTFGQVDEMSNRFANVLIQSGLGKGDKLAILAGNGLWTVALDFACVKAGIARVPLNGRLSVDEHERMIRGTDTTTLVHDPDLAAPAGQLRERIGGLTVFGLGVEAAGGGADLLEAAREVSGEDPQVPLSADDPLLILHTSGTTGVLKAATHTQGTYAAVAANILANVFSPEPGSVMLHAASLIHASGTFVLPYWVRGAASAILPGFEPAGFLDAIARYRATEVNMVPTMLGMLLASGQVDKADLSSLKTILYGASPMPRPLIGRAMDEMGPIFMQYYGQTEAPLVITVLSKEDHRDPSLLGSCGRAAKGVEIRLVGEDGNEVGVGEIGEMVVRMPSQMVGYYDADELNAEMLTPDDWIRTRDMAYVDERGYYFLVDRRSDMIISGGYNVYPREVEDALAAHPAVAECAVVGAPDPTWVEAVTAFVSLVPGAEVTEAELQQTVRDTLAGYKVPKKIVFTDAIPKSAVGKILRRALRDPLWEDSQS